LPKVDALVVRPACLVATVIGSAVFVVALPAALFSKSVKKAAGMTLNDVVLANSEYVKLITGDIYVHKTYNMGMVDANNCSNFYDGKIRVTSPAGKEHAKYDCSQYREYVAERVEPWSYLKFPYLKKIGWKGFVDGDDSGVYKATPLSRCNAADGMATPPEETR